MGQGFPDSSFGKESVCSAGDPSLIPGLGRSTGDGTGYPLQYSWASLIAQLGKNPPAMWETWVQSLGWEDPLEEGMATHSSILAWRIPWTVQSIGSQSRARPRDFHFPPLHLHWGSAFPFRQPSSLTLRAHFSTFFLLLLASTFSGCPGFFSGHHPAFLFLLHTFPDEKS